MNNHATISIWTGCYIHCNFHDSLQQILTVASFYAVLILARTVVHSHSNALAKKKINCLMCVHIALTSIQRVSIVYIYSLHLLLASVQLYIFLGTTKYGI